MSFCHLVRVGILGQVGRFRSADSNRYARGTRVICRTVRGVEVGSVLAIDDRGSTDLDDGTLLRRVTTEDDLLIVRLEKNRNEAYQACVRELEQHGVSATLMDVEQLFDGSSLYFYFLGSVPEGNEKLTHQLAEAYESRVQFRKFTEAVTAGCGPACGTEDGPGCGDDCSSCAIAEACHR